MMFHAKNKKMASVLQSYSKTILDSLLGIMYRVCQKMSQLFCQIFIHSLPNVIIIATQITKITKLC